MERTQIIKLQPEQQAKVEGLIHTIRKQKHLIFIILEDVTGLTQIVVEKDKVSNALEIETLTQGSVISVVGYVVKNPASKFKQIEVLAQSVQILSVAENLPINDLSGIDARLNYRWVDLRSQKNFFIFKLQTLFLKYMRDYFVEQNCIEIHTPKTTCQSSEGGSEVFEIKNYFGKKAYLTQSPQLYKQMAMASGFDRIFEVGPYFRAEPSFTSRHATEFTGVDVELSYINSHHDIMDFEEQMFKYILKHLKENFGEEFKEFVGEEIVVPTEKFPRLTLKEVYELLSTERNYKVPLSAQYDLDTEAEKLIGEVVKEKFNSDFVFIVDYPFKGRAFYSMKHDNSNLTKSFDLIYKGQEITSGAMREHRYEILKQQIADKGIKPEHMESYLDFFKYGCPPHGGFGLGLARVIAKLLNLPSIKDVTFLFRGPNRINP